MVFVVKLEQFEGPLNLLLGLIEREELSITEISLAKVTDEYLRVVRAAPEIKPEDLADFLVVAAKLILIKSQTLLPGLAVREEEGPSLADQLRLYREFVEASRKVEMTIKRKHFMFGRAKPLIERAPEFSPPPKLTTEKLAAAFRLVLAVLEPIIKLPQAAVERAISIQEKIGRIRQMILDRVAISFHEVLAGAKSKTEVIVSFLALLELVKQRVIDAEQRQLFCEITVQKH